jgi:hypothetical protein
MEATNQCDFCERPFTPAQMGGHLHSGPCAVRQNARLAAALAAAEFDGGDGDGGGAYDGGAALDVGAPQVLGAAAIEEEGEEEDLAGYEGGGGGDDLEAGEDGAAAGDAEPDGEDGAAASHDDAAASDDGAAAADAGAAAPAAAPGAPQSAQDYVDAAEAFIAPAGHVLTDGDRDVLLESVKGFLLHRRHEASFVANLRVFSNRAAVETSTRIVEDGISKRQWDGCTRPSLIGHDRRERDAERKRVLSNARRAGATDEVLQALQDGYDLIASKRSSWMTFRAAVERVRRLGAPVSALPTVTSSSVPCANGGQTVYNTALFSLRSLVREEFESPYPSGTYQIPTGGPTAGAVDLCDSHFVHKAYTSACNAFASNAALSAAFDHLATLLGCPGGVQYVPWPVTINEDGTRSSTRRLVDGASFRSLLLSPHAQDSPDLICLIAILQKSIATTGMSEREQALHARNYAEQWKLIFDQFTNFRTRGFLMSVIFPGGPPRPIGAPAILYVYEPLLCMCSMDNESANKVLGVNPRRCLWCTVPYEELNVFPLPPSAVPRAALAGQHRANMQTRRAHAQGGAVIDIGARRAAEADSEDLCLSFFYPPAWPFVDPSFNILFSHATRLLNSYVAPDALHIFSCGLFQRFGDLVLDRIKNEGDTSRFNAYFKRVTSSVGYVNDGCRAIPHFSAGISLQTSSLSGAQREWFLRGVLATLIVSMGRHSGLSIIVEREMAYVLELLFFFHSATCRERSPPQVLDYIEHFVLPSLFRAAPDVFIQDSNFCFRKWHSLAHILEWCRRVGSLRNVSCNAFEHHNKSISSTGLSVSHAHRSFRGVLQHANRYWLQRFIRRVNGVLDGKEPAIPNALHAPPPFSATAPINVACPVPGSRAAARVAGALAAMGAPAAAIATVHVVPYVTVIRSSHGRARMHGTIHRGQWIRLKRDGAPIVLARVCDMFRDTISDNLYVSTLLWKSSDTLPAAMSVDGPPPVNDGSKSSLLHKFVQQCNPPQLRVSPITHVQGRAVVYGGEAGEWVWAPKLEPQEYP